MMKLNERKWHAAAEVLPTNQHHLQETHPQATDLLDRPLKPLTQTFCHPLESRKLPTLHLHSLCQLQLYSLPLAVVCCGTDFTHTWLKLVKKNSKRMLKEAAKS
jgi:hypothetical protein